MNLNEMGELTSKLWAEIPSHFSFVELGNFVIMPDYTHGILIINNSQDTRLGKSMDDAGHLLDDELKQILDDDLKMIRFGHWMMYRRCSATSLRKSHRHLKTKKWRIFRLNPDPFLPLSDPINLWYLNMHGKSMLILAGNLDFMTTSSEILDPSIAFKIIFPEILKIGINPKKINRNTT